MGTVAASWTWRVSIPFKLNDRRV